VLATVLAQRSKQKINPLVGIDATKEKSKDSSSPGQTSFQIDVVREALFVGGWGEEGPRRKRGREVDSESAGAAGKN